RGGDPGGERLLRVVDVRRLRGRRLGNHARRREHLAHHHHPEFFHLERRVSHLPRLSPTQRTGRCLGGDPPSASETADLQPASHAPGQGAFEPYFVLNSRLYLSWQPLQLALAPARSPALAA